MLGKDLKTKKDRMSGMKTTQSASTKLGQHMNSKISEDKVSAMKKVLARAKK